MDQFPKITYKIRDFDENIGQITVEYFGPDGSALAAYAIDLPIENSLYPVGERLEQIIMGAFPFPLYERAEAIKAGVQNKTEIKKLVDHT